LADEFKQFAQSFYKKFRASQLDQNKK
jgi:hypothetical protein